MLSLLAAAVATVCPALPDRDLLSTAVFEAIGDEIAHGILATKTKDMVLYMETVPEDYRQVEDDGSVTDKAGLRRMQEQAWAVIPRTNRIEITVKGFQLACDGENATVWTDQLWDRQMLGRDGVSEHNVVTTQKHREEWKLAGSRWVIAKIDELGGSVAVDGKPLD